MSEAYKLYQARQAEQNDATYAAECYRRMLADKALGTSLAAKYPQRIQH